MMTGDAPRLFVTDDPPSDAETADVLKRLQESTLELLAGLDRAPKSLRIRADQVEIELEWPEVPPAAGAAVAVAAAAAEPARTVGSSTERYVTAQMVGVFYHAPSPGADPFVAVGDVIEAGQQVGIVEAMKLMIAVEADVAGRVVEVLVPDGATVEYGEKLFAVEPADG